MQLPYDADEYARIYAELKPFYRFCRPEEYEDEVMCIFEGKVTGTPCPFAPNLHFREGEVTLWGAPNGNGKSLLTGQMALQLADAGESVAIMSFEMLPKYTFARLVRQRAGRKDVGVDQCRQILRHYNRSIGVLDHVGAIDYNAVLGAAIVAKRDYEFTHIIIDNLTKIVAGDTDLDAQKEVVQCICDLAHQLGVHIHLIHHVRKTAKESDELDKFSFKGSSAIVDQVDNAILIQRNRAKEKKRFEGNLSPMDDQDSGDTLLKVVKQRNGDWEGEVHLWFNTYATAFCLDVTRNTPWEAREA